MHLLWVKQVFHLRMSSTEWLLFLVQVPASPSSTRVALWRRLRAAGAVSVLNGAWVLPRSTEHAALFEQLAATACENGGGATVFITQNIGADERNTILAKFRTDRAREYEEFQERTRFFLTEVRRETRRKKFTFAELEELEDDLAKLTSWLAKIRSRDFFPTEDARKAADALVGCEAAFRKFSEEVYRRDSAAMSAKKDDRS